MRVRVLGCGVSGLTAALRLAEAGHDVEINAAAPPRQTTSAVAGALWYPYRAYPEDQVTRWSALGYQVLSELSRHEPAAGVRLRSGRELFKRPTPEPWWRTAVPDFGRTPVERLPAGYVDGYELTLPVVDMPVHLDWLRRRLTERGVGIRLQRFNTLWHAASRTDAVVNCTGLGSRGLVNDSTMKPVRGQVVVVEQFGQTEWLIDQEDPLNATVVIPRDKVVMLGGTAESDDEDLTVRPATTQSILARCGALVPRVAQARVLEERVGIRPTRPEVRLERQDVGGVPVVHCYGHGGAGVTLAYGCAQDVVEMISSSRSTAVAPGAEGRGGGR
jgi:D-amino-acid oxidase